MSEEKKMLLVPVGEAPRPVMVQDVNRTLHCEWHTSAFDEVVSDELEITLLVDDCGKINGSLPNRCLRSSQGELLDIVCGDFLIAAVERRTGDVIDMPEEAIEIYRQKYKSSNVVLY